MANVDVPKGAWPVRHLSGGEIRTTRYEAGGVIYRNDFVIASADGKVDAYSGTGGGALLGVAANFASGDGENVDVYDDPNIVFGVQADDALTSADIGMNIDVLATSADTNLKRSKHEGDASTKVATTAQLRIVGIIDTPGNDWGANQDIEVVINEHFYKQTAGV